MSGFRNFAPQAAADLEETVSWLLDRSVSPAAAERLLKPVLDAAERLVVRAQLGRRRPALLRTHTTFGRCPGFRCC